ncbi:MAG: radical SAM family heme chaperone HemW [Bacteroidales bacterium]|nr:radical SAM family heme chaperone HemW [Bacteroidales bacterium]
MIYVHIPYCHAKCSYCAFFSVAERKSMAETVQAICREIEQRCGEQRDHAIRTVYFGGGTPTLLPIEMLQQIVEQLQKCYDLSHLEEATIEANPEDLTTSYLHELRQLGLFNRLSIGIQSLNDDALRLIRRRHTAAEAIDAIKNAHAAGFDNISIDLIYGIPNQSLETWNNNLSLVRQIDPHHEFIRHLSCYALTIEPHTIMEHQIASGQLTATSEDEVLRQYDSLAAWCSDNGFEQYEVSNYCQKGFSSRHNSRYWDRTPYTGIGPGAHSLCGMVRRWNVSNIRQYIDGVSHNTEYYEQEELTRCDVFNEYLMTALRTAIGLDKATLDALMPTKHALTAHDKIARLVANGLLTDDATHYRPTAKGLLQADSMAADLFADNE